MRDDARGPICRGCYCADCGVDVWPWEMFMLTDEVWSEAVGDDDDVCHLCVGCVEDRLDRALGHEDFPPLPLNDDHETDSVRLRLSKGSGRKSEQLYALGLRAVLDLGLGASEVAERLGLLPDVLSIQAKQIREVTQALDEEEETQ